MSERPPVLLFDVMSTLVYEPFEVEVPAFFGMTFEELVKVKHPSSWREFEVGAIDEVTFLRMFFRDGREFDHEGLKARMVASYRWLEGMEALLGELHGAGFAIHALSNYPDWYQLIEAKLDLSRFLEWSFVSCRTGVRKPAREAYVGAARALEVPPADCVFVDDREQNCRAARAQGMGAVLFRSAEQVRADLAERGLLPSR